MTEAQLTRELKEQYGSFLYAHEVAEYMRKSKSRIGKWLDEHGVDYLKDGTYKKYYVSDVAKAVASDRVRGYMAN